MYSDVIDFLFHIGVLKIILDDIFADCRVPTSFQFFVFCMNSFAYHPLSWFIFSWLNFSFSILDFHLKFWLSSWIVFRNSDFGIFAHLPGIDFSSNGVTLLSFLFHLSSHFSFCTSQIAFFIVHSYHFVERELSCLNYFASHDSSALLFLRFRFTVSLDFVFNAVAFLPEFLCISW